MTSSKSSTPNFGDAIRPFIDAELPRHVLIPVSPPDAKIAEGARLDPKHLGKAPGSYNSRTGKWSGLKGDHLQEGVRDPAEQRKHDTWLTGNVGIVGRFYPAIDSDAETDDARRLVEQALFETFGRDAKFAERVRGTGPRRLYAFRVVDPDNESTLVQSRTIRFKLPTDPVALIRGHGLDIIGSGKQFVAVGTHPKGDEYTWHESARLTDLVRCGELIKLTDADIVRFLEILERLVVEEGGAIISSSECGNEQSGPKTDYSNCDPAMPIEAIFEGLRYLPNTDANFPHRDGAVQMAGKIRAALGREAIANEGRVFEWVFHNPDDPDLLLWDAKFFEPIWRSLDSGVSANQTSLDYEFRKRGIKAHIPLIFAYSSDAEREADLKIIRDIQDAAKNERERLLAEVSRNYVFSTVNTSTDDNLPQVRPRSNARSQWEALKWWKNSSPDRRGRDLLNRLQKQDGWGKSDAGFWAFFQDLTAAHSEIFFLGTTRHPHYGFGELVPEDDESGATNYRINMRHPSRVQTYANSPARNEEQAQNDVTLFVDLVERLFGGNASYELDTLAYMAQTGKRPGHLLFLVGHSGVGKSIFVQLLTAMFNGRGPMNSGRVEGAKLADLGALRFAFADVEGCRIINIKELPNGAGAKTKDIVTSILKTMVDPGPEGDYFAIEPKFKGIRQVENFSRVVITSNHQNALQVEAQDRRIFYVEAGITLGEKPPKSYYDELDALYRNNERLAAVWRYLLIRDISKYDVAAPPPVSLEKWEAQIAAMEIPLERHAEVALMVLKEAGRRMFDGRELTTIMSAMSENEFKNSRGAVDDRREYGSGHISEARELGKVLSRKTKKLDDFKSKSNGVRAPTIYIFTEYDNLFAELKSASRKEVFSELEMDRKKHPLSQDHRITLFTGPLSMWDSELNSDPDAWGK